MFYTNGEMLHYLRVNCNLMLCNFYAAMRTSMQKEEMPMDTQA